MEFLDYIKRAATYKELDPADFPVKAKVNLITNFTDDILKNIFIGAVLAENIYPEVYAVPYRQYQFELKDNKSRAYKNEPDISFLFFDSNPFRDAEFKDENYFEALLADIEHYAETVKGTVVVSGFVSSRRGERGDLASIYNKKIEELCKRFPNAVFFDTDRLVHFMGEKNIFDLRGIYAFDIPFTHEFMVALAEEWLAYLRALVGKAKKAVVVDLDNTLWGGVVGELGAQGIALGPDYPGNAFVSFQHALLELSQRGVILAINSRNNPEDVAEVFEKNAYMVLKEEHFSSIHNHWEDKADHLLQIANELNIGVDSIVFFDDDPLMRAMVKGRLPEVSVPDLSVAPEHYTDVLYSSLNLFKQLSLTGEDLKKGKMYAEERQRKSVMAKTKDVGEYIKELGLHMEIRMNDPLLVPRVSQLTLKTNQFNLTTRRYAEHDIKNFIAEGALIFSGSVADKFGDYGTVILAIVVPEGPSGKEARLDTFLMSCRVMGRGIECSFMDHIIKELARKKYQKLHASFVPTAKNKPAEHFLSDHGFAAHGKDFALDIKDYAAHPCAKVTNAITITS